MSDFLDTIRFSKQPRAGESVSWYHLRVLTPVFGGGVDPLKADPATPIRTSAIRHQLRFWWRAVHGVRCADLPTMQAREASIWGSTRGRGLMSLDLHDDGSTIRPWIPRDPGVKYAAYPALQAAPRQDLAQVVDSEGRAWHAESHGRLRVTIRPSQDPQARGEIDDAFRAWTLFGGVGGRTRRGFGAIQVAPTDAAPDPLSPSLAAKWIRSLGDHRSNITTVPSLLNGAKIRYLATLHKDPIDALEEGLATLLTFRQGNWAKVDGHLKNSGQVVMSASVWPEAKTVRALRNVLGADPRDVLSGGFPRAAFGLPIQFSFQHDKPPKQELLPKGASRRPSTLIIRPLFNTQEGKYQCLALRMSCELSTELELSTLRDVHGETQRSEVATVTSAYSRSDDANPTQRDPMLVLKTPPPDALAAFMEYFSVPTPQPRLR